MTISKSNLINKINTLFKDVKEVQYNIYTIIDKNSKESIEFHDEIVKINFSKINDKTLKLLDVYIKNMEKGLKEKKEYEKDRDVLLKKDNYNSNIQENNIIKHVSPKVDIIEHVKQSHYKRFKTELNIKLNEDTILEDYNKYISSLKFKQKTYKNFEKHFKQATLNKRKVLSNKMCVSAGDYNKRQTDETDVYNELDELIQPEDFEEEIVDFDEPEDGMMEPEDEIIDPEDEIVDPEDEIIDPDDELIESEEEDNIDIEEFDDDADEFVKTLTKEDKYKKLFGDDSDTES